MKDSNLLFCKFHIERHILDIHQAEVCLYNSHPHRKEHILLQTLFVESSMILWNANSNHFDSFDISWGFHMSYMYVDNAYILLVTYHQL